MSRKTSRTVEKAPPKSTARKPRNGGKAVPPKTRAAGSRSRAASSRKTAPAPATGANRPHSGWLPLGDYALGLAMLAAGVWILVKFLAAG